jgi:hypothetical protein
VFFIVTVFVLAARTGASRVMELVDASEFRFRVRVGAIFTIRTVERYSAGKNPQANCGGYKRDLLVVKMVEECSQWRLTTAEWCKQRLT